MPRQHLLTAMTKSHDLFRFIATSVDPYRQQECLFSTLTAFWASSVLAYIERMKKLQPQDMAVILPVILQSIKSEDRDLRLGSYIVLSHLAARTDLSQETASLLAETMLVALRSLTDLDEIEAALTTLAILCEHQDETLPAFSQKAASLSRRVSSVLVGLAERVNIAAFLRALLPAVIQVAQNEPQFAEQLREILASPACPEQITQVAMHTILDSGATSGAIPSSIAQIVESVEQRLPDNVSLLSFASNQTDMRLVKALQTVSGHPLHRCPILGLTDDH